MRRIFELIEGKFETENYTLGETNRVFDIKWQGGQDIIQNSNFKYLTKIIISEKKKLRFKIESETLPIAQIILTNYDCT